ncbi:MAG TPA: hypothetical protein PK336_08830, partial [Methanoculleus sp.]|nr:hypothetical protein [Methanoculleus sp.]
MKLITGKGGSAFIHGLKRGLPACPLHPRKIRIAGTTAQEIMLLEHLVYSTAIAIVLGTLYRRYTGRDHAWLVVASAYVPDLDIVADGLLQRIGITVMVHGSPIRHGNFHNAAVMLAYAVFAALLLHPAGVRL